ncbi:MAG: hypothetical protein OXD49_08020 [Candidatus Poribacteria bacterium]|nr:hypothetical protein [Candidatus Poribacteria bacterium]
MKIQHFAIAMFIFIAIFTLAVTEMKESAEAATTHIVVIRYYRVIKDVNGKICSRTYLGKRESRYDHEHSGGTVYHRGTSTNTRVFRECP